MNPSQKNADCWKNGFRNKIYFVGYLKTNFKNATRYKFTQFSVTVIYCNTSKLIPIHDLKIFFIE